VLAGGHWTGRLRPRLPRPQRSGAVGSTQRAAPPAAAGL